MESEKVRHPLEVSGSIRHRAEMILKRRSGRHLSDTDCANHDDAQAIRELLTELDESINVLMLEASLKEEK